MRLIFLFMVLAGLLMATAPSWIKAGQVVSYDMRQYFSGGSPGAPTSFLEFTVTERSGDTIRMELKQTESTGTRKTYPSDNTTKMSGQFWFDPTLLASGQFVGQYIYDWQVEAVGTKVIGGREWDTITIKRVVDGANVHNTYDKKSGLLLNNVVVVGSQTYDVIYKTMNPPVWDVPAPQPAPAPANTPAANPSPNISLNNSSTPAAAPETDEPLPPADIPAWEEPEPEPQPATNIPCCPGIFIFGLIGAGVVLSRR